MSATAPATTAGCRSARRRGATTTVRETLGRSAVRAAASAIQRCSARRAPCQLGAAGSASSSSDSMASTTRPATSAVCVGSTVRAFGVRRSSGSGSGSASASTSSVETSPPARASTLPPSAPGGTHASERSGSLPSSSAAWAAPSRRSASTSSLTGEPVRVSATTSGSPYGRASTSAPAVVSARRVLSHREARSEGARSVRVRPRMSGYGRVIASTVYSRSGSTA